MILPQIRVRENSITLHLPKPENDSEILLIQGSNMTRVQITNCKVLLHCNGELLNEIDMKQTSHKKPRGRPPLDNNKRPKVWDTVAGVWKDNNITEIDGHTFIASSVPF